MLSVGESSFEKVVLESSQPVLVNFGAPWCGLCHLIQPLLLKFQSQWDGQLKVVSINADQCFRLATTYRLKSLPTLILFERGQVVRRLEGFQGRDDLEKQLKGIALNCMAQSA